MTKKLLITACALFALNAVADESKYITENDAEKIFKIVDENINCMACEESSIKFEFDTEKGEKVFVVANVVPKYDLQMELTKISFIMDTIVEDGNKKNLVIKSAENY